MMVDFTNILLGSVSALALHVGFEVINEHADVISNKTLNLALALVQADEREELAAAWRADISNLDRPVTKLITALGCVIAASRMRLGNVAEVLRRNSQRHVPRYGGALTIAGSYGLAALSWTAMVSLPVVLATVAYTPYAEADGCPVVIDTNLDGRINVTGTDTSRIRPAHTLPGAGVLFDLDGDGAKEFVEWIDGTGDSFLIENSDGNALFDMTGLRLFGNQETGFRNGYEELEKRDLDGDGMLSGAELDGIELWTDDGDAIAEAGEIHPLAAYEIVEIGVDGFAPIEVWGDSEQSWYMRDIVIDSEGRWMLTEDVWFFDIPERNKELYVQFEQFAREEHALLKFKAS